MRTVHMVAVVFVLLVNVVAIAPADANPVESLVMVDSKGTMLGPVVEFAGPFFKLPLVPFKAGNSVFVLSIFKDKVAGSGNPVNLYFDNRRCGHKTG